MPKNYDWNDAIRFLTTEIETHDELYYLVLWRRLQAGDRTQDLLMTISALEDLKVEAVGKSPEWTEAIKWLNRKRAEEKNLRFDILWNQLETGDRSEELLLLIQDEMTKETPLKKSKST